MQADNQSQAAVKQLSWQLGTAFHSWKNPPG